MRRFEPGETTSKPDHNLMGNALRDWLDPHLKL